MIKIPEHLKGKELFKFLIENKAAFVQQKKSLAIKYAEPVSFVPSLFLLGKDATVKAAPGEVPEDTGSVRVKVVANTSWWCDSQMDVLTDECYSKTIRERKGLIPHLHDHVHTIEAEIGDVADIYTQTMSLTELGLNIPGTTTVLIFETDVKKAYNEKVYDKYRKGKVKQHSIGLQYMKIELAINDSDYEKENDFWNKYINKVINKKIAEEKGFFWLVPEIKLLENSAVLFGANEITPTLDVKTDTTTEPQQGTQAQPSSEHKGQFFKLKFEN